MFPGVTPGSALSVRRIRTLMAIVGERAVRLSPHVLRHTMATRLVRRGVDLVTVAEAMGHSSVEHVMVYTRPTEESVRVALSVDEDVLGAVSGLGLVTRGSVL